MVSRRKFRLKLRSRALALGERTLIMGVLNVTPDSFSDGAQFLDPDKAIAHGLRLETEGADILDIGAESTRPGSTGISEAEELRRLLPVLEGLKGRLQIPISVDTRKARVAEMALGAVAEILNDISGLRHDPVMARVAARFHAPIVLMHIRGTPETMQKGPFARDVLRDVTSGLRRSVRLAREAGVAKSQIILDPGIGFGKTFAQNYELLAELPELAKLGYPLLVGTSRKGFLGRTFADEKGEAAAGHERLWATAATVTASILGGAHIVRVHDVSEMAQVAKAADCLVNPACLNKP